MSDERNPSDPPVPRGSMVPPEVAKQVAPSMENIYVFTMKGADGIERMVATITPRGMMPMVGLEGEQAMMEQVAQEMCNTTGTKIQLWKYQDRALVKTIERQLVQPVGTGGGKIGGGAKVGGMKDSFKIAEGLNIKIKKDGA